MVKDSIAEWILLLVFGGFAVLCLSYLISLSFERSSSVQKYGLWVIILIFFALPIGYVSPLKRNQNYSKFDVTYVTL